MIRRFRSLLQLNVHDHAVIPDGVFADDANGRLTSFELPPPNHADVESIALGIAKAVTKALAQVDPPAAAEHEHEHLAVATDVASVGLRFGGREDSEPARKRTPSTAVVQSELGTFTVHAHTAPIVSATKTSAPVSSV